MDEFHDTLSTRQIKSMVMWFLRISGLFIAKSRFHSNIHPSSDTVSQIRDLLDQIFYRTFWYISPHLHITLILAEAESCFTEPWTSCWARQITVLPSSSTFPSIRTEIFRSSLLSNVSFLTILPFFVT